MTEPLLQFLLDDADAREQQVRLRELRLLATVYFGPKHAITTALSLAITDPSAIDHALRAIEKAPALPKRRLLATYMSILPDRGWSAQ